MANIIKKDADTHGPIFDHVRSVMTDRLSVEPPVFTPPISAMTEKQMLDRITQFVKRGLKNRAYSYDPLEGKLNFRFTEPFDLFQELSTGEKAYDFLRSYFIKEELWDDVDFINFRTGVTEGNIILTSKKLSAQSIQTTKNKPL